MLEPKSTFAPAVLRFDEDQKGLVYDVQILLECLCKENSWEPMEAWEWYDYNIECLSNMEGGPVFYDKMDELCLTHEV